MLAKLIALTARNLRLEDTEAQDAVLSQCVEAAFEKVLSDTGRTCSELLDLGGGDLPATARQAVIMTATTWYEERSNLVHSSQREHPFGYYNLINPLVKLG